MFDIEFPEFEAGPSRDTSVTPVASPKLKPNGLPATRHPGVLKIKLAPPPAIESAVQEQLMSLVSAHLPSHRKKWESGGDQTYLGSQDEEKLEAPVDGSEDVIVDSHDSRSSLYMRTFSCPHVFS